MFHPLYRYNLTSEDVKNEARFEDSVGVFPEFIDGYNILILPTTGRYFQVCAKVNREKIGLYDG